jgi:hypothetical protein
MSGLAIGRLSEHELAIRMDYICNKKEYQEKQENKIKNKR